MHITDGVDNLTHGYRRRDANGKTWLWVYYENDGVKNTPMKVTYYEGGLVAIDEAAGAARQYIGVPAETHATGVYGWIQIGGEVESMITPSIMLTTVGYALKMSSGLVQITSADFSGADGEFAVTMTATTAAQAYHNVYLVPEWHKVAA